jgi:hypothetical protein
MAMDSHPKYFALMLMVTPLRFRTIQRHRAIRTPRGRHLQQGKRI